MSYSGELSLLCEVFQRSRVNATVLTPQEWLRDTSTDELVNVHYMFRDLLPTLRPCTVYRLTDSFECCYRLLVLPEREAPTVLCLGPYLSTPVAAEQLLTIGETNGIPPQKQALLGELYNSLAVLSSDSPLFTVLHAFCERIWRTPSYAVKDLTRHYASGDKPFSKSLLDTTPDDTLAAMRTMERRYAFENEIIRAVTLGHLHMEKRLFSSFSDQPFEKRIPDLLRNAKNYCVIMNTLLRKAAEAGGVHPLQLDRTSSDLAARIENMSSLDENGTLMCEIFRTYCRLVRDHSLGRFSTVVKQTILIIDTDLSADLAPSILANSQRVSLGYLCAVFKRETGKTLSEYIRERRMEYASYLLTTTELQIQTVALHCGIMDVQYFSKLFKREHGLSPTEYRLAHKRTGKVGSPSP